MTILSAMSIGCNARWKLRDEILLVWLWGIVSGVKARVDLEAFAARLKSRPDTVPVFFNNFLELLSRVKPLNDQIAGLGCQFGLRH